MGGELLYSMDVWMKEIFFLGGGGREGGVRLVKLTIRGGSFTPFEF